MAIHKWRHLTFSPLHTNVTLIPSIFSPSPSKWYWHHLWTTPKPATHIGMHTLKDLQKSLGHAFLNWCRICFALCFMIRVGSKKGMNLYMHVRSFCYKWPSIKYVSSYSYFFWPPSLVSYFHKIALFCKSSIEGFPFIFMDGSQGQILLYPEAHPRGHP